MKPCALCGGDRQSSFVGELITYVRMPGGYGTCPRCTDGTEPAAPDYHPGMILRHRRSKKLWVVYSARGTYGEEWGIHRMVPDRVSGGHYVWQIRLFTADVLDRNWIRTGLYGDAWDHEKMEADPLTRPRRWTI